MLAPIWLTKRETANRVRGRTETIIAKNVDINDKDFRNPAELTKQLREKLPKRPKRVVRHHPALPYAEASRFMADLCGAHGRAAVALRFLILTVGRTSEIVGARWTEIDRAYARKLDRAAALGRVRQDFGRGQDRRHVVIGFGDGLAEMRDGFPQRLELGAIGQFDRLVET